MTNQKWKELQTEIAKLKEQDDRTTERVAAELDVLESNRILAESAANSRKEGNHASARIIESNIKEIKVPCSLEQDTEWANESI